MSELPTSPSGARRLAFTHKPNFTLVSLLHYPLSMYEQHRVPATPAEHQAVPKIRALVAAARTTKGGRASADRPGRSSDALTHSVSLKSPFA